MAIPGSPADPGLSADHPAESRPASALSSGGQQRSGVRCLGAAHLGDAGAHQPTADDRHVFDDDLLRRG